MSANFSNGPTIQAQHDDGVWWASCPQCPGFTAVADSFTELFRFVSEFHADVRLGSTHSAWTLIGNAEPVSPTDAAPEP